MDRTITLSPSRVNKWIRCKKQYDWRYNHHLVRRQKEVRMSMGNVVGRALERYYSDPPDLRASEKLVGTYLPLAIEEYSPVGLPTLGQPTTEASAAWSRLCDVALKLLSKYHDWAKAKDNFAVVALEADMRVPLSQEVSLRAIPDAVVSEEDNQIILEHKVRHRYKSGQFNIDYQSAACCIVANAVGTYYNVLEYGKLKLHREPIMRSQEEIDYFRQIYLKVGEDILRTDPRDMYPAPWGRCSCEYWELCNGEYKGLDVDDIVRELYVDTHKRNRKEVTHDDGEGKDEDGES